MNKSNLEAESSASILNIVHHIRSRGFWYLFGVAFCRVVPPWLFRFRVSRVFELAVDQQASQVDSASIVCSNDHGHLELAQEVTHAQIDLDKTTSAPMACLFHRDGDNIGGLWIGSEYFCEIELGIRFQFAAHQRWLFSAFVRKDQRGGGVYRQLLAHALDRDSTEVVYCTINPLNRASLAAHRRFIRRMVGTCVAAKFLGMTVCWGTRGAKPQRSFSMNCRSNPIVISLPSDSSTFVNGDRS